MAEVEGANSWREELVSLVDTSVCYADDPIGISTTTSFDIGRSEYVPGESFKVESEEWSEPERFRDQVKGFLMAWCEILMELGRGCRDILEQNLVAEDSYVVRKLGGPCVKVSKRLRFLNDYLPEDRDPVHAWSVVLSVFFIAFAVISVNSTHDDLAPVLKKVLIHPPCASRILLPDGRYMAYQEKGVPVDKARYSIITPHSFLSSRLAGIPGVQDSLLEDFGIHLVTYDLPGFGESDPNPSRDLNSSAMDILNLAQSIGVNDKFWLLGHSTGCMHIWAAVRYIPDRIAGAAMFAPMINPYEPHMTRDEMKRAWGKWLSRRKLMYQLARRFPKLLSFFYRRSFLSGKHDRIDKQLSYTLGKKDDILLEEPKFEEFSHRDVEESVRQGNTKPFIEEAVLQVSNWGFGLSELRVQKCQTRGILHWLKSLYSQAECELAGFLGPIHIWQGMDDQVFPPSMTDYVSRVLPWITMHRLPSEGHLSYYFFCDECHRQIFSTLFGTAQGPVERQETPAEGEVEVEPFTASSLD